MNIDKIQTRYEYMIPFKVRDGVNIQMFRDSLDSILKEAWKLHRVYTQELEFDAWHLRATAMDSKNLIDGVKLIEEKLKEFE